MSKSTLLGVALLSLCGCFPSWNSTPVAIYEDWEPSLLTEEAVVTGIYATPNEGSLDAPLLDAINEVVYEMFPASQPVPSLTARKPFEEWNPEVAFRYLVRLEVIEHYRADFNIPSLVASFVTLTLFPMIASSSYETRIEVFDAQTQRTYSTSAAVEATLAGSWFPTAMLALPFADELWSISPIWAGGASGSSARWALKKLSELEVWQSDSAPTHLSTDHEE